MTRNEDLTCDAYADGRARDHAPVSLFGRIRLRERRRLETRPLLLLPTLEEPSNPVKTDFKDILRTICFDADSAR